MSFVDKILSGKYPQIEKIFQREFGKVIDEVFDALSSDFEELDEFQPAKQPEAEKQAGGTVSLETYDRVTNLLEEERIRHEATRRELDVVRQERATLQYKLDAARHELST
jgi:hypothetical protein